jgi:hypothetical protein
VLSQEGINIKVITTSEIKISVLIDRKYMELAVQALHDAFELDKAALTGHRGPGRDPGLCRNAKAERRSSESRKLLGRLRDAMAGDLRAGAS